MGASAPRLIQVIFSRNRADFGGGGMANAEASSPTLNHVTFRGNEAITLGGGMHNLDSSPVITNTMFRGNRVGTESDGGGGGGLSSGGGSPRLTNVVFSGNWSTSSGGGMVLEGGNPVLTNVTFAGNRVEPGEGSEEFSDEVFVGGGLGLCDTRATLINCVLAGNAAPSGPQIGYVPVPTETVSTATIRYSAVQGSGGSGSGWDPEVGIDGGGNIDADPRFVAPVAASAAPTTTGDYRLQIGSPAVDAGTNGAVAVTMDLDGNPRVVDGDGDGSPTVDMGAYERPRPVGGATVVPTYWPLAVDRKLVVASVIALGSLAALAVALLVRRGRR